MNFSSKTSAVFKYPVIAMCGVALTAHAQQKQADKPNIILIYADDLGYGDVSCYGAVGIKTTNIDKLSSRGLRFINAHAAASTCSPSRFSLLTGKYSWRQDNTAVAPGDAALIIDTHHSTIASVLKNAGYSTGVVGKWHLGLGEKGKGPDWNGEIRPGPCELGFDYSFIMPATNDRVPCVYVENSRVVGLDPADPIKVSYKTPFEGELIAREHPELLRMKTTMGHNQALINGIGRIGYMTGGKSAIWKDEDMSAEFTRRAKSFIQTHKKDPFFLYLATSDIHVPHIPDSRFVNKSKLGLRGDAILQLDWTVGEIVKLVDSLKLMNNTIIILTSDNGPVVDDGYADNSVEKLGGHKPAGPLRGGKYSIYDGGTRIPFIVSWPGTVKKGITDALVCQVDFLASFASLTAQSLKEDDAPDSFDMINALLGKTSKGRESLVEHSTFLALVKNDWKYIEPVKTRNMKESGYDPEPQLYNIRTDLAEKNNVAGQNPELVRKMAAELDLIRKSSKTR